MRIHPNLIVYDTPSGMGGLHTVALIDDTAEITTAFVVYGSLRDGQWTPWHDWHGYRFPVARHQLTNRRRLGSDWKLPVSPLPKREDRDAQLLTLRVAAPKRADAGRVIAAQDDASDCPLFRAADEPRLL